MTPLPAASVSAPWLAPGAAPSRVTRKCTALPPAGGPRTKCKSRAKNRNSILPCAASSTPFEKFEAKVYIDEDRKTSFRAEGFFSLSEGNSGIDPFTQSVELQVGIYAVTIPAGSFKEKGKHDFDRDRDRKEQEFEFKGEIDGVDLTVRIEQMNKNEYIFTAEGRGDILQGIKNPVAVALTIGNYEGSASVKADIDK